MIGLAATVRELIGSHGVLAERVCGCCGERKLFVVAYSDSPGAFAVLLCARCDVSHYDRDLT